MLRAYFYLGEYTMIAGKQEAAGRLFQQSVDTGVTTSIEYTGARAELKRLSAVKALPTVH
jgi:lipoprotein NlpI